MRSAPGAVPGHGSNMAQTLQAVQAAVASQNTPGPVSQSRVQEVIDWLAECNVDLEAMADCSQELISLYEAWEHYNEKTCKEQINRFAKANALGE